MSEQRVPNVRIRIALVASLAASLVFSLFHSIPAIAAPPSATLSVTQTADGVVKASWKYRSGSPSSQKLIVAPILPLPVVADPLVPSATVPAATNPTEVELLEEPTTYSLSRSARSKIVEGLTPGQRYSFTLSSKKPSISVVKNLTAVAKPGSVSNLKALWIGKELSLVWDYTGSPAKDFSIAYTPAGGKSKTISSKSNLNFYSITGLKRTVGYTVSVSPVNSAGKGSKVTQVILQEAPNKPTNVAVRPLTANGQSVQVTWEYEGPALTASRVRIDAPGYLRDTEIISVPITQRNADITGLSLGGTYKFIVELVKLSDTEKVVSEAWTAENVPTSPNSPVVTPSNSSINLKWFPSAAVKSTDPITGYRIDYAPESTRIWKSVVTLGTATTYNLPNLENGVKYNFRIMPMTAKITGLSSEEVSATAGQIPTSPSAVKIVPALSALGVTWTAPSISSGAILGYRVEYRKLNNTAWTLSDTTPTTSLNITSLDAGTTYEIRVIAVSEAGSSSPSPIVKAAPFDLPASPVLTATAGSRKADLRWTAPANNGSTITSYKLEQQIDEAPWTQVPMTVTSGTTFSVTALLPGNTYKFRISAINAAGTGEPSNTASAIITTVPDSPVLTLTPGAAQIALSWSEPVNNGGVISYYKVERSTAGGSWSTISESVTSLTYLATGLSNGTRYNFRVSARNASGWGLPSSGVEAIPFTSPAAVVGIAIDALVEEVRVRWTAMATTASSTGGSPVTGYEVSYRPTGGTWVIAPGGPAVSSATSFDVGDLNAGVSYDFRVAAINATGVGAYSISKSATPYGPPVAPSAVSAIGRDGGVEVSWTAPLLPVATGLGTSYKYKLESTTDRVNWNQNKIDITDNMVAVTGLQNGVPYTFRVSAGYTVGGRVFYGESSQVTATPRGIPSAPQNFSAVQRAVGNDMAFDLTWSAPPSFGGGSLSNYELGYTVTGSIWKPVTDVTSTITSIEVVNKMVTMTTSAAHPFLPGDSVKITGLAKDTASGGQDDSPFNGTYTVAQVEELSIIFFKDVADRPDRAVYATGTVSAKLGQLVNAQSYTFTVPAGELVSGAPYTFRIRTRTALGLSNFVSTEITPVTLPTAVTGLAINQLSNAAVTLSWNASPANQKVIGYRVQYSVDSGTTWTLVNGNYNGTMLTVSGLSNGLSHIFRISANNPAGFGTTASITGIPVGPVSISNLSATPADSAMILRWTQSGNGGVTNNYYQVRYSIDAGATWTTASSVILPTATSYTVSGLTNGQSTIFEVTTLTSAGSSTPVTVTATPESQLPTVVQSLAASPSNNMVYLTWLAPATTGYGATRYRVEYKLNSSATWLVSAASVTTLFHNVTALTASSDYNFRVVAYNAAGDGPSATVNATTAA